MDKKYRGRPPKPCDELKSVSYCARKRVEYPRLPCSVVDGKCVSPVLLLEGKKPKVAKKPKVEKKQKVKKPKVDKPKAEKKPEMKKVSGPFKTAPGKLMVVSKKSV